MEFHDHKIVIQEAKTPSRTLISKLSTNALVNNQQSLHRLPPNINDVRSRLPTAPTEEQDPTQNINSTFPNATIPKKKNIVIFYDSIHRGMKMKHLNSQVKEAEADLGLLQHR